MITASTNQVTNLFVHERELTHCDTAAVINCRLYLEQLLNQVGPARVRRVVGTVFQDLMRLLECLTIIEGHLQHIHTAEESLAFFHLIRDEAKSLMEFIRSDALGCDQIADELADALDGITFALSHDLRRVFEGENEVTGELPNYVVLGRVHRAHDVLTNCLQQSTISLAVVFDKTLLGTKLFNNSEKRYRQSLRLCSDLTMLRELVQELIDGSAGSGDLTAGLQRFRNDSLEFLMYSDWPQFESFCERIHFAANDASALPAVLHQFLCYLETLLRQVKMRAVLADALESMPSETECYWHLNDDLLSLQEPQANPSREFVFAV